MAYLKRAGVQWDRRVRKSLNAMCSELKMACQGQPRISTDREELLNKWDELSNYTIGKIFDKAKLIATKMSAILFARFSQL